MGERTIDLVLFDLGNVLIKYGGMARMKEWTAGRRSMEELLHWWQTADAVMGFEKGQIAAGRFAEVIVDELELPVTPARFLDEAVHWFEGPFRGARALLEELSFLYTLGTLANTNGLYWPLFLKTDISGFFTFHFPSHLTGLMKPDPRAYGHVVNETGIEPHRILFLDDRGLNVEQARKAGMQAFRTVGIEQVRRRLSLMGLVEK